MMRSRLLAGGLLVGVGDEALTRYPRLASAFWTLTLGEEDSGRPTERLSTHDLWHEHHLHSVLVPSAPTPGWPNRRANLGAGRPKVLEAESELRTHLSAKVAIIERGGQGRIRIPFADLYELERLYTAITGDELDIAYPRPSEK